MGKPSKSDYPGEQPGETADAVSLHTTPGTPGASRLPDYHDEHDEEAPALADDGLDDLPPLYSDAVEGAASATGAPLLPPPAAAAAAQPRYRPFQTDAATGAVAYMERALESSPRALAAHLAELAKTPPRPQLRLVGTHSETRRKSDGKSSETTTVTDFALTIEMAPYLYADAQHRRSWAQLRSVDNDEKAHRGTLFARRGARPQAPHVEAGRLVDDKPSLEEWCHRFCASHAGLKCFTLRRRVTGFDLPRVREQLTALVRRAGYRGRVDVDLVTRDARADVYNEARTNRWRLTRWVRLLFFFTMLWLLAWPYLWLRTRRWEVAVVDWPFSRPAEDEDDGDGGEEDNGPIRHHRRRPRRYVALSEDQWYNLWARAIHRAVLDRRQKTLDQDDLRAAAAAATPSFEAAAASDGAAGLLRAGLGAMSEMNIQMGWGADE